MTAFVLSAILLAALALLPACRLLGRVAAPVRGRGEAAVALHRAQLRTLERDAATGLMEASEHGGARLEIERRLLLAADALHDEAAPDRAGRTTLAITLVAVPVLAAALYLVGGHPGWPADPLGPRLAAEAQARQSADVLVAQLRASLATLDARLPEARAGEVLLGNVEARLGHWAGAAAAWRAALRGGFDAALAHDAAEAGILAHGGRVGDADAALLRQALAAAPADAPWRLSAEARLAEAEHQSLAP